MSIILSKICWSFEKVFCPYFFWILFSIFFLPLCFYMYVLKILRHCVSSFAQSSWRGCCCRSVSVIVIIPGWVFHFIPWVKGSGRGGSRSLAVMALVDRAAEAGGRKVFVTGRNVVFKNYQFFRSLLSLCLNFVNISFLVLSVIISIIVYFSWYFGAMTRQDATDLLMAEREGGVFLVR